MEVIEKKGSICQLDFETKKERDKMYFDMKKEGGRNLRRWMLQNQEIGYSGFGSERDLRRRNVYMLDVMEIEDGCSVGTLKEIEAWEKHERVWNEEVSE